MSLGESHRLTASTYGILVALNLHLKGLLREQLLSNIAPKVSFVTRQLKDFIAGYDCSHIQYQHSGGKGRWVSVVSRPSWSTE